MIPTKSGRPGWGRWRPTPTKVLGVLAALLAVSGAAVYTFDGGDTAKGDVWSPPDHPMAPVPRDHSLSTVDAALQTLDACDLLDLSAGARVPGIQLHPFRYVGDGTAYCSASDNLAVVGVHLEIGTSFDRTVRFDQSPSVIDDTRVYVEVDDAWRCAASIPVSFTRAITITATNYSNGARKCPIARTFAKGALERLADRSRYRAAWRLTYRPDEPDMAAAGACVDVPPIVDCEPYHEVVPPHGIDEIGRAAELDPDVHCAIAREAVREHLGTDLRPTTIVDDGATSCIFVEPTHATEIWVRIGRQGGSTHFPNPTDYEDLEGEPDETFAGLPVYRYDPTAEGRGYSVLLDDGYDPMRLDVVAMFDLPRRASSRSDRLPDMTRLSRLLPTVEGIVSAHLA